MLGLHLSHRTTALALGCCAAALGVTAAPASSHTLDLRAMTALAGEHSYGGTSKCKQVTRHRVDCSLAMEDEASHLHRYELRGGTLVTDEDTHDELAGFWTRRARFVIGRRALERTPWLRMTVDYRTRRGGFYAWRVGGGEGNLRLTCPDGTTRMTGWTEWHEVPAGSDGRFAHTDSGTAIEGKLTGRDVRGWVSAERDGCKSGRVPFSGRTTNLPRFIT